MRVSRLTSASRGTLCSVTVSRVRRLAIIRGSAAVLAPLIGIVPFRRWPPTMRIRSMVTLLPHAPDPLRSPSEDSRLRSQPEGRLDLEPTGQSTPSALTLSPLIEILLLGIFCPRPCLGSALQ